MYTKSIIQQTVEAIRAKDSFKTSIENLMEKYNIEDSVFVLKNGFMNEVVEGYFVTENEYDNLDEAMSNCDVNTMGIRIIGNVFHTGKIYNRLSECVDSNKKVFDLKRLENVR